MIPISLNRILFNQDPRRPGDPKNLKTSAWRAGEGGLNERDVTYELFQDFIITKALINVTVKQVALRIFKQ